MLYTDNGTKVSQEWLPLAFANGLEWSVERRGMPDRFHNLYNKSFINRALWYLGSLVAFIWRPKWLK